MNRHDFIDVNGVIRVGLTFTNGPNVVRIIKRLGGNKWKVDSVANEFYNHGSSSSFIASTTMIEKQIEACKNNPSITMSYDE